jgi:hypothetical protein
MKNVQAIKDGRCVVEHPVDGHRICRALELVGQVDWPFLDLGVAKVAGHGKQFQVERESFDHQ